MAPFAQPHPLVSVVLVLPLGQLYVVVVYFVPLKPVPQAELIVELDGVQAATQLLVSHEP